MTFLEFNMKLNEIISAWLEDGGNPFRCADALRMAADEVFEEPMAPERHPAEEHIIAALRALQTDDDREHDTLTAEHAAWARSGGPRGAR